MHLPRGLHDISARDQCRTILATVRLCVRGRPHMLHNSINNGIEILYMLTLARI